MMRFPPRIGRVLPAALICLAVSSVATPAHALTRDGATNKFNWGDDLSETGSVGGVANNYDTRPPAQFKSNHLPDIKNAIDLSVTACGITDDVYVQTDREAIAQIGYAGRPVSSAHVNNLRRAIEELYRKKGQVPPAYLAGNISPGDPIQRKHINDMRRAIDDLIVACAAPQQASDLCWNGFYSQQYFPTSTAPLPAGSCPGGIVDFPGEPYYMGPPMGCSVEGQCAQADNGPVTCECIADIGNMGRSVGCCDPQGWIVYYKCGACPAPVCGNGMVERGEQCDNSYLNGACPSPCSSTCQVNSCPGCWAPIPESMYNQCNGAQYPPPSGAAKGLPCPMVNDCARLNASAPFDMLKCSACTLEVTCGNGVLQPQYGEQCDDGNTANGDGCTSGCQTQVCGNGTVELGEQCDQGATNGSCPSHCNASCQVDMCGQNGPCGETTCYACVGEIGTECARDDLNGTYQDPNCNNACTAGIGSIW